MELKWIVFLVMAWVIVALLVGVAEGVVIGGAVDPTTGVPMATSTLSNLAQGDFFQRAGAMVNVMTFDFPEIFYGGYAILHWIFFLPFVIAFGLMMLAFILSHIPIFG